MQLAEEEIADTFLAEYGRREIAEMKQFVSIQFLGKNEPWNHIVY
jgi:hypothetical protein